MWAEPGTVTFSTAEPYRGALRSVRAALNAGGLSVLAEFDVASHFGETLGIRLPPCRILFVWPKLMAGNAFPAAAMLLPLHVVVAGRARETEISILSRISAGAGDMDSVVRSAISWTHTALLQSLERFSIRPGLI